MASWIGSFSAAVHVITLRTDGFVSPPVPEWKDEIPEDNVDEEPSAQNVAEFSFGPRGD